MQPTAKLSGETPEERKLRREELLKYGPIFAPALRFSFDYPEERKNETETDQNAKQNENRA